MKLKKIKARSIEKGLAFDLTEDDLIYPDVCPILGIPIIFTGTNTFNSPSVDRINTAKGYTKDNIRMISNRANMLRNNATVEELELILADARKLCLT